MSHELFINAELWDLYLTTYLEDEMPSVEQQSSHYRPSNCFILAADLMQPQSLLTFQRAPLRGRRLAKICFGIGKQITIHAVVQDRLQGSPYKMMSRKHDQPELFSCLDWLMPRVQCHFSVSSYNDPGKRLHEGGPHRVNKRRSPT